MKRILEVLGFVALVQGVLGLLPTITGRLHVSGVWGVVRRVGFLDGYEVYASVALIVLSVALFAAAESRKSG
ncbi:hypothetical protein [Streptomyces sp. Tue6028]|uniref:hypothetical protein n=1 Tax=Streptomyces sp. Tue6028 TaxID=2036037 RepID=UPI003EB8B027